MSSTSQQFAIVAALVAALGQQSSALAEAVFDNRSFTLAEGVASQINVNVDQSKASTDEMFASHPVDWTTSFEVVIKARRAADGTEAAHVCDGIWCALYALVFTDPSIKALVMQLTPGDMDVGTDEADTSIARITWYFTALHRTTSNTLT